jgi:two-component system, sensor histidine kinase and response regulator
VSHELHTEIIPEHCTILLIDDNLNNLKVTAYYLRECGFKVLIATNGELGLDTANHNRPDLILLDVMMPGIDGFETCRRLQADPITHEIPVIFMTALAETNHKVIGFQAGAVDYVIKPIQQEELLARITTHLRIRELTKQLRKANADKDKFFSIVAHDLKGPFMPLLGNLQLLERALYILPPEEIKSMIGDSSRAANQVYRLLEDLLDWAQLQMGRMVYQPELLNLYELCQETLQILTPTARSKGIELKNEVPDMLPVYADKKMLTIIIRNLVNNALKFTAQGSVTIAAVLSSGMVEIAIKDTGIGIEPQNLDKLFKMEVHHTTAGTAKEKGTGLGLILCKEMVEIHGGQIQAESAGQGATIKFTVPAYQKTTQ